MSEETSRKARGLYDKLYGRNQAFYDYLIAEKSFIKTLEKFSIKELSYLSDLYEKKVAKIKKSNQSSMDMITRDSDILAIAISVKLRTVINKRKINVSKYRYSKNKLDVTQMAAARKKLENVFKDVSNSFWESLDVKLTNKK